MPRRNTKLVDWGRAASQVAGHLPLSRWHPAVLHWAGTRRKNETWAVALSGGADSLALLLLLWAQWPERRERLVVLHFNHRLRGRESLAEEKFCQRVCRALGVVCVVGRWAEAPQVASEAAAREARHGFFAEAMKAQRTKVLWLAHQQDDIAETMLMRVARGSGLGGLVAPRPIQVVEAGRMHVRPLLGLKKVELVAALRRSGVEWREDSSNRGDVYWRNRVRRSVVPAWVKAAGRDALAGAAWSRELLEEDELALERWVDQIEATVVTGRMLAVAGLAGLPRAVVRRILHRWLRRVRVETDLSRQGFGVLLGALERGAATRFSLGSKGFAVIRRGQLAYERK